MMQIGIICMEFVSKYNIIILYMPRKRFRRRFRKRRYIKKTFGGHVKDMIDGRKGSYIKAGMSAIPYLIKSAAIVKSMINAELKIDDQNFSFSFDTGGTFNLLNGISQGVTESTHIGKSILMKDLVCRFSLNNNITGTTAIVTVIVFIDKQANSGTPTQALLLQLASNSASPLSPLNNDQTKRFVVCRRWYFTLDQIQSYSRTVHVTIPLNVHTTYDGTDNLAASISSNSLWLYACSSAGASLPSMTVYTRLRFYDT